MATMEEKARGRDQKGRGVAKQNALAGFGVDKKNLTAASWDEAHPDKIAAVVVAVSRAGGAVMFGASRDGGALSLTLYLDGDRKVIWVGSGEEPDEVLEKVSEWFIGTFD